MCRLRSKICPKVPKNTGLYMRLSKQSAFMAVLVANLANAQSFTDITTGVISSNLYMTKTFGSYVVDWNADGCLEPFTLSHGDGSESALYIQDVDAEGLCAGTFAYVPRTLSNHSLALPANRVCPMRATFGNFWGYPNGMWGYYCSDPGGSIASRYKPALSGIPGGFPVIQISEPGSRNVGPWSFKDLKLKVCDSSFQNRLNPYIDFMLSVFLANPRNLKASWPLYPIEFAKGLNPCKFNLSISPHKRE